MCTPYADRCKRRLEELDLGGRRRVQVYSHRSTLAIDQNHPLRPLAPLGFPDAEPPFLPVRNCRPRNTRPNESSGGRSGPKGTHATSPAKHRSLPTPATVASRSPDSGNAMATRSKASPSTGSTESPRNSADHPPEAVRRADSASKPVGTHAPVPTACRSASATPSPFLPRFRRGDNRSAGGYPTTVGVVKCGSQHLT
jgi:hypothetical protein